MDNKKLEFIDLIDRALDTAEQMKGENQPKQLNNLIGALQTIKSWVIADQLEPSQGIITLGLVRGVADCNDFPDSPLLGELRAIEQYYQKHL